MAGNNISSYAYVLEIAQNKVKLLKTNILEGNTTRHRWRYFTVC